MAVCVWALCESNVHHFAPFDIASAAAGVHCVCNRAASW